ncbi:MAG: histidine phosphatase family protein [Fibrobacter sp.]|nr:histidine phosphatase family protein [Fibrobacter sp.]
MKSKIFSSAILASVVAAGFAFTACGDDNNPGNAPTDTPVASSSSIVPVAGESSSSAGTSEIPGSSSSAGQVLPPEQQTDAGCAAGQVATPVDFPLNDFVDIGEIYKNIQCNEKVVFIVRHGERERFIGNESCLTEDGFDEAVAAGKKIVGTEPFKYIFSGMTRTYQTALGFAVGRGEAVYDTTTVEDEDGVKHLAFVSPAFAPDTLKQLKDGWYIKDKDIRDAYVARDTIKNVNVMYTAWAYEGTYADAFYDIEERSLELIGLIVKDYASMPKYTLAASHDQVLAPLVIWATNKQVDLKLHAINEPPPRNWLNYLAGVAIIINDKNEMRYVAVKGGDSGVQ